MIKTCNCDNDDEIDLIDLLAIIIRGRKTIVVSAIVSSILAVIIALLLNPYYTSIAIFTPRATSTTDQTRLSGLSAFSGMLGLSSPASLSNGKILAVANSWSFRRNLAAEYNLKLKLFPELWDDEKKNWCSDSAKEPSDHETVRKMEKMLIFSENKETGFITVFIKTYSADFSNDLARYTIEFLDRELCLRNKEEAQANRAFLENQLLNAVDPTLKERISNLIAGIMEKEMVSSYKFIDVLVSPVAPDMKSGPNRKVICFIGLVIGIFVGFAIVFLLSLRSRWSPFLEKLKR